MKKYQLNGEPFELDESLDCLDFYYTGPIGHCSRINWKKLLVDLQKGTIEWANIVEEVIVLSRWVHEAPRKRKLRQMAMQGINVVTSEELFECPAGEDIINQLENTGKIASQLCQHYGVPPMPKFERHENTPIKKEELLAKYNQRNSEIKSFAE